jgi:DNA-directed RNA polymerase specialized sigma24 family protein
MTEEELDAALAKLVQCRTKLTDEQVALLGRGWKTLVRSQHDAVKRQVEKRVPARAVEDVEADVFADLYEALLDGFPESLGDLTRTIATRRIADWYRDHEDDAATGDLASSGSLKPRSSAPTTEGLVELRELRELGEELRSLLSPEHQDVFDLVLVGEVSYTAAAEDLGLAAGTLSSRVLAMKRALRAAWRELMVSKGRPPE